MLRVRFLFTAIATILLLGTLLLARVKAAGDAPHSANDSTQRTQ